MESNQRSEPAQVAGEFETLTGFLQFQRETLAWKCSGLTPEQLRRRAVPPSALSLLGLVRHLTDVERTWFRRVLAGEEAPFLYWGADSAEDTDFEVEEVDAEESIRLWERECARSSEIVGASKSLDRVGTRRPSGATYSLRWILTHMIEEYARHNGHADLLREVIDGQTGE
ncbi:DinB family protein [Nocardia sp. CS682]|uniref:DinB family protein n=1 Tax=Nocardia sp. CS682 TaxID=1047172 RepID=UPI001074CFD2|nr:DinB family protein [Nocardia sp. CS682]QBS44619.1 Mini-circle protein [Nocardia sp. CS682]